MLIVNDFYAVQVVQNNVRLAVGINSAGQRSLSRKMSVNPQGPVLWKQLIMYHVPQAFEQIPI